MYNMKPGLHVSTLLSHLQAPWCRSMGHSLYGSTPCGPEDDSVESKHVALLSYYTLYIFSIYFGFDWPSPHYIADNGFHQNSVIIKYFSTNFFILIKTLLIFFLNSEISEFVITMLVLSASKIGFLHIRYNFWKTINVQLNK